MFTVLLSLFSISTQVQAETSSVYISEIAWAGSSKSTSDEWIELTNNSEQAIDLSGWRLVGAASNQGIITIPEGSIIQPDSVFFIANYDASFEKSALDKNPDYVTSDISLSNSSLHLILENTSIEVIDEVGDGGVPFAGNSVSGCLASMIRLTEVDSGTNPDNWKTADVSFGFDDGITDFGTPGIKDEIGSTEELVPTDNPQTSVDESETSIDSQVVQTNPTTESSLSSNILVINEFVSDPVSGEKEWVEIYNPNSVSVNLMDFTLTESGGKKFSLPDQDLEPYGYFVLILSSSVLNNNDDTITILDSSEKIVDQIIYGTEIIPAAQDPNSVARKEDGTFFITSTPTPGTQNIFSTEDLEETESTADETTQAVLDSTSSSSDSSSPQTTSSHPIKSLIINEFVSDPISGEKEWIEIYNPQNESINLAGFTITEESGKIFPLPEIILEANTYLVIEIASSSLNNSGDTITILDPLAIIIDQVIYGTEMIPATSDPNSVAKNEEGIFLVTTTPTPGMKNIFSSEAQKEDLTDTTQTTTSQNDSSSNTNSSTNTTSTAAETNTSNQTSISYLAGVLLINEFVSDPSEGEKEWVEIYNPQNESISLKDWSFVDGSQKTISFPHETIESQGYFILEFSSSILNNGGDTLKLLDPSANIIDEIIYGTDSIPSPKKSNSLARINSGGFEETTTPTPGSTNQFTQTSTTTSTTTASQDSNSSNSSSSSLSTPSYPTNTLIINEFYPDAKDEEKEWVEIYNPQNESIALNGWVIKDASGRSFSLPNQTLESKKFVVMYFNSGFLNNQNDTIYLLDPSMKEIHKVEYGTEQIPTAKHPYSVARKSDGIFVETVFVTKGQENVIIKNSQINTQISSNDLAKTENESELTTSIPAISYEDIRFSEIYPNTIGSDETQEFIELINTGGLTIDLTGYFIKDLSGKTWTASSLSLNPNNYIALERTLTKISLNNTGKETLFLYDPNGNLLQELSYANSPKGLSYAQVDETWYWTAAITRAQPNTFQEPLTKTSTSISGQTGTREKLIDTDPAHVRDLTIGTRVRIRGIVSVVPGTFTDQTFYLAGSGIQIFKSDGEFPELAIGEEVELTGVVSSNRNEMRIKMAKTDEIKKTGNIGSVHVYSTNILDESLEGFLVKITGLVVSRSKEAMLLEQNGIETNVRAKPSTSVDFSSLTVGSTVEITGITSQIDDKYYLLVRGESDVNVITPAKTTTETPSSMATATKTNTSSQEKIGVGILLGVVLALIILAFRSFILKKRFTYGKPAAPLAPARGI